MMPTYANHYKGCKVYVYDLDSGKTVAETKIMEWNKQQSMIIIDNSTALLDENLHVSILIPYKTSLHEYKGTTRRSDLTQSIGIALFHGREKQEYRSTVRYNVNIAAQIVTLLISDRTVTLKQPLNITVINISKSGMLIRTVINTLNVGTRFQVKVSVGQQDTVLNIIANRIHRILENEIEFGCRLLDPKL